MSCPACRLSLHITASWAESPGCLLLHSAVPWCNYCCGSFCSVRKAVVAHYLSNSNGGVGVQWEGAALASSVQQGASVLAVCNAAAPASPSAQHQGGHPVACSSTHMCMASSIQQLKLVDNITCSSHVTRQAAVQAVLQMEIVKRHLARYEQLVRQGQSTRRVSIIAALRTAGAPAPVRASLTGLPGLRVI